MSLKPQEEEDSIVYRSGLTWRSLLAIFYSAFFLMPVGVFYSLLVGGGMGGAVYIIAFLFAEIAIFFRTPLTKQEVSIIFSWAGSAAAGGWFLQLLFNGYFANSPIAAMFQDPFTGKSLIDLIPWWMAPPSGSEAYKFRTFFTSYWLGPVAILLLTTFFSTLQSISLVMITSHIYIDSEKLPFPLAEIDAGIIETLAERGPAKSLVFMLSAFVGLIWGIILYAAPIISNGIFRVPLLIVPIPWVDLTQVTEMILPGAMIGFATDLMPWLWGSFLPGKVVVSMLAASVSLWVVGNWLTASGILPFFPQWTSEYTQGMRISLMYQRSTLWVWVSPIIGITLAAGIFPLVKYRRDLIQSFKRLLEISPTKGTGIMNLKILVVMYLAGSIGFLALFHYIIPGFPIWIAAVLTIGFSLFMAFVTGRMQGETGFQASIPYVWEASILASGYPGVDVWFYGPSFGPPIVSSVGGNLHTLKVFQLVGTDRLDYFKAWIIVTPLSIVVSFIVVSLFWSIAPIPSSFYPNTIIAWPVNAINTGLWATRQFNILRPDLVLGATVTMLAIATIFEFIPVPFSLMGIVVGTGMLPPTSFATFGGWVIGKYLFERRVGRERWLAYRTVFAGGILAGEGIALGVAAAAVIIVRSLWLLPY